MRSKYLFSMITVIFICFGLLQVKTYVLAEQSGTSPESGVTSRIITIYDSLVLLTHGLETPGGWGDWGVIWNRVRSAAEWVPSGDADEADVASGKLFYKDSRTQKTGTASLAMDFSTQSKVAWDDSKNGGGVDDDNAGEESVWINTAGTATTGVWKDTRTGLYWSSRVDVLQDNIFTIATCAFFTAARGTTIDTSNCGNSIISCHGLSLDATGDGVLETNWYLPSQKELLQAYLDGIYNQTNTTFVGVSPYWTSTEAANDSNKAFVGVMNGDGQVAPATKSGGASVRCVRRD